TEFGRPPAADIQRESPPHIPRRTGPVRPATTAPPDTGAVHSLCTIRRPARHSPSPGGILSARNRGAPSAAPADRSKTLLRARASLARRRLESGRATVPTPPAPGPHGVPGHRCCSASAQPAPRRERPVAAVLGRSRHGPAPTAGRH